MGSGYDDGGGNHQVLVGRRGEVGVMAVASVPPNRDEQHRNDHHDPKGPHDVGVGGGGRGTRIDLLKAQGTVGIRVHLLKV
jgi:hypothetical protein